MNLYCDITNQRFAQGFRVAAGMDVIATQSDVWPLKIYLVRPNRGGGRFPFVYDENSGAGGMIATVALSNPGGTPLTLVEPVTFDNITNGFSGVLQLNTEEIATFLAGRSERVCALSVEVTDGDGNRVTSFLGYITLRMASTDVSATSIPGVIRDRNITAYTGGTPTDLEGIVTVGKALGTQWIVTIAGSESHWELVTGSAASNADAGVILTTDGGQLKRTIGY